MYTYNQLKRIGILKKNHNNKMTWIEHYNNIHYRFNLTLLLNKPTIYFLNVIDDIWKSAVNVEFRKLSKYNNDTNLWFENNFYNYNLINHCGLRQCGADPLNYRLDQLFPTLFYILIHFDIFHVPLALVTFFYFIHNYIIIKIWAINA